MFDEIARVKPSKLYIASDGPRIGNYDDYKKVAQVRSIVKKINWICDVQTLFNKSNLGCKNSVSSSINWFFDNEEYGIILEDDCLPDITFFQFCEQMLVKYRNDPRILSIVGCNINSSREYNHSYFFSNYALMWGWASWSRAWNFYRVDIDYNRKKKILLYILKKFNLASIIGWISILNKLRRGKIDTWDFQWIFTCWLNNGLSIVPKINLISNIGHTKDATHTNNEDSVFNNLKRFPLEFPLSHPTNFNANIFYDRMIARQWFKFSFRSYLQKLIFVIGKKIIKNEYE